MRVYLFDGSEADLRGRVSQAEAAGLSGRWEIVATPSRNELLGWLDEDARASPRRQSIALVDYRTESGDIEQLGFRIVEQIRRHGHLWKATRPAIWLDRLSTDKRPVCARRRQTRPEPANAELARRFLAAALPGAPDPLAELSWPAFSTVRRLRHDPAVLRAAYLEPGAETVLDHFLALLAEVEEHAGGTALHPPPHGLIAGRSWRR